MRSRLLQMACCSVLVAGVGCASDVAVRPAVLDPSNPDAPESAPVRVSMAPSSSLPDGGAPPPPTPHQHDQGAEKAKNDTQTIYTCPMHPEIRQTEPGRCPKCGMKLVPAEPAPAKDGGHP